MENAHEKSEGPISDEVTELFLELDEDTQDAILSLLRCFLSDR